MKLTKREPTFYERELERLEKALETLTPGTDEYQKILDQILKWEDFNGKRKEHKARLSKADKGSILGKVVGFLGIGGLIFGLTKFEKIDGSMFSGSSGEAKTGLLKAAFKLFG